MILGPGSVIGSGEDADYLCRTYLAGITIEHVPDMTVFHHHGRKTRADGFELYRRYLIGSGALSAKYLFKHAKSVPSAAVGFQARSERDHHRHQHLFPDNRLFISALRGLCRTGSRPVSVEEQKKVQTSG